MESSVILNLTDNQSGKPVQKNIPYINPEASADKLKTFGQMTAALTKDTYVGTTRVDKIDLDTATTRPVNQITLRLKKDSAYETVAVNLSNPVINVPVSKLYFASAENPCWWFSIYTPADGTCPTATFSNSDTYFNYMRRDYNQNYWLYQCLTPVAEAVAGYSVTINLHFIATTEYNSYDLPITINITEDV